jgi:hypothetical protein
MEYNKKSPATGISYGGLSYSDLVIDFLHAVYDPGVHINAGNLIFIIGNTT